MLGEPIEPDEFDAWLTPAQATKDLQSELSYGNAVSALTGRLRDGLLKGAAETIVIKDSGQTTTLHHVRLKREAWPDWLADAAQRFWRYGAFERQLGGYGNRAYAFHGVRFEPTGVRKLLSAANSTPPPRPLDPESAAVIANAARLLGVPVPAAAVARATVAKSPPSAPEEAHSGGLAPKVSPAALVDWVRDYGTRNPSEPFRVILHNAKLHFEPKWRVTERPVRDAIAKLGMTLSVGSPLIPRKKR